MTCRCFIFQKNGITTARSGENQWKYGSVEPFNVFVKPVAVHVSVCIQPVPVGEHYVIELQKIVFLVLVHGRVVVQEVLELKYNFTSVDILGKITHSTL